MIKQYFKQALSQLKQQPLLTTISVLGTALTICLIMVVVMQQQIKTVPFAPESNRNRLLHVKQMSVGNKTWSDDGSSNGPMGIKTAKGCFEGLKTPEEVSIYSIPGTMQVSLSRGQELMHLRQTELSGVYSTFRLSTANLIRMLKLNRVCPWLL